MAAVPEFVHFVGSFLVITVACLNL